VDWIQSLSKAIHYIENNLTNDISVDDVSNNVYASSFNFQRVFNLVTGMTIGDYIRNRRLSLAGQELLHTKNKIIDVAMRYQYDTQESFSKAFTRFHGFTPSSIRKQKSQIKVFHPLTIQVTIQGGFNMSRKIIDNIPLHQLQYPEQGQNYVFNGCMKFLMECMGEDEQYDYWFFSAVSGDCYVQVYGTNKNKWHTCFSQSKFDYALIQRVCDAIGYDFSYIDAEDWQRDKDGCKAKIISYIDKGIPVIGKGFYHSPPDGGEKWPTDEVSCIIGYENNGERFYRLPEEATDLVPFTLDDHLPYTFVFIEGKKKAPPVAEVYRKALMDAPQLMRTPPGQDGDVFFGNSAFEQWANMLENDFYRMKPEDFKDISLWRYYSVYICIIATNIYSKRHTTDRAIQMNPELTYMAPLLDQEYKALGELENQLKEAGGDFNVSYEILQDTMKCQKIARIMKRFPDVYSRICDAIEYGKQNHDRN
jgi:AraC-like DNA-binding protein